MNKEKNFMSAIVYVHNAEDRIGKFLEELIDLLDTNFEHSEIICVNDFSTDNSVTEIKKASNNAKSVALSTLNMSYFHGMEIAMNAGVDLSIGDFVLEIDDVYNDYDMQELMNVYHKMLGGYDIVAAVSAKKHKLSSKLFYWIYEKFTDDHIKMQSESFRLLSRRAINRVGAMSTVVPYRKGLYAHCGLKYLNVNYEPVNTYIEKMDGVVTKYRGELAIDSLIMFTNAGYTCAKALTVFMTVISVFMIIYTLAVYAMAKPVEGWTTTILFLAVAFCGLFAILTIIVKYLQILLNLNFKRKKYTFESIEKLTK